MVISKFPALLPQPLTWPGAASRLLLGHPVALDDVVSQSPHRGHPTVVAGRRVATGFTWEPADLHSRHWWPQGITTSSASSPPPRAPLLVTAWYVKDLDGRNAGARISVVQVANLRYEHILLLRPDATAPAGVAPLQVHAGGVAWVGPYLYVAATLGGVYRASWQDLVTLAEPLRLGGQVHRYGLLLSHHYRALPTPAPMRYSFLSLSHHAAPPHLLAGEYSPTTGTSRLLQLPLGHGGDLLTNPDGHVIPTASWRAGLARMQGAVSVNGHYVISASNGRFLRGWLYEGDGQSFRRHRRAVPVGCEDLTWWPQRGQLWSQSEYPGRRWVYSLQLTAAHT